MGWFKRRNRGGAGSGSSTPYAGDPSATDDRSDHRSDGGDGGGFWGSLFAGGDAGNGSGGGDSGGGGGGGGVGAAAGEGALKDVGPQQAQLGPPGPRRHPHPLVEPAG